MKWHIQTISTGLLGLGLTLTAGGCLSEGPAKAEADTAADGCGDGEPVEVEGVAACLYRGPITETGFQCPPQLPGMYAGDGFAFCAAGEGASDYGFDMAAWKAGATKKMVDVLFVVDNSTSMCEEQVQLTKQFGRLLEVAEKAKLDLRVAVTTADAQCSLNGTTVHSSQGVFNANGASGFPPSCYGKTIESCSSDDDCADGFDAGWRCKGFSTEACMTNPNGSINTTCQPGCGASVPKKPAADAPKTETDAYAASLVAADAECADLFGEGFYCHQPSGSQADWGCMQRPLTGTCPLDLPPVLESADLQHFACIATVGVIQDKCFKYEQGLKTARLALDPEGPNAAQATSFLRPKAHLAVIFVTDEDDCSTPDDAPLSEDYYDVCAVGSQVAYLESLGQPVTVDNPALLAATGPSEAGNPLVPVAEYADFFKSLKPTPAMVSVGVVTGVTDDLAEAAAFVASKGSKVECYKQTSLCASDLGKSDWGSRYVQLAEAFGANGVVGDICAEDGVTSVLDQMGALLSK